MPQSPPRRCSQTGCNLTGEGRYCPAHQQLNDNTARRQQYDRDRADDPIRKLYRTPRWKATRRAVLNRDILCVACGHHAANETDHILSARLVVDNFGINEFYNPERCQGLCHICHSSKTALECGWTGRKGTRLETLGDRSNTTVVCGPAGSGKTTYVQQHMQPGDPVYDYDVVMAEITGLPMHQGLPGAIGSVLAQRDQFIMATERSKQRVWVIVSNPKAEVVKMLRDAGAAVVVLATPDDVCQQRLKDRFIAAAGMGVGSDS